MKKFFTTIFLFIFIFSTIGQTFALTYNEAIKQQITSSQELNKTAKGKQYLKAVDAIISQKSNDKAFLQKTKTNLDKSNLSSTKNTDLKNLVRYLQAKVEIALENVGVLSSNTQDISQTDKQFVEQKITKIQSDLINQIETIFPKIKQLGQKTDKFSANGDLKVSYGAKINFALNNYKLTKNNNDLQFGGDVKYSLEQEGFDEDFNISTSFDSVLKKGDIYLLIKNFVGNVQGDDYYGGQEVIDTLKDFASKNKYIKITDDSIDGMAVLTKVLKEISSQISYESLKKELQKPLFEFNGKKDGDRYLLQPSKQFCNILTSLDYGELTCDDAKYKLFLEGFKENNISFYLSQNGETIGYKFDNRWLSSTGYLTFKNSKIAEGYYDLKDENDEGLYISYKNGKLVGKFNANGITASLDGTGLNDFEAVRKIDDDYENLNGNLKIAGKNFNFTNISKSNYSTSNSAISGNFDDDWILDNLDVNILRKEKERKGYDYETDKTIRDENWTEAFNVKIVIKNKVITGTTTIGDYVDMKIITTGNYSKNTLNLKNDITEIGGDGKIDFDVNLDFSGNKSDVYVLYSFSSDSGIWKSELDHKGTRNYANIPEIQAPKDFVKFGETDNARNTKRIVDISDLAKKISIEIVSGNITTCSNFVKTNGTINFEVINGNGENFKDPNGSDYKIECKMVEEDIIDVKGRKIKSNEILFRISAKREGAGDDITAGNWRD